MTTAPLSHCPSCGSPRPMDRGLVSTVLGEMETCKRIFEFCLDEPFDRAWWQHYRDRNLQCDVRASMATLVTRQEQIGRMFQEMEAAA